MLQVDTMAGLVKMYNDLMDKAGKCLYFMKKNKTFDANRLLFMYICLEKSVVYI